MSFDEVISRIKEATGAKTQEEIAIFLDIRQATISGAKKRGMVPADWYIRLMRSHGLNPQWLADGIGPKYLPSIDSDDNEEKDPNQVLVWNRYWILERFKEVLKVETDKDLAAAIGVTEEAIGGARQHRIPPHWVYLVAGITGVVIDDLLKVDTLPWELEVVGDRIYLDHIESKKGPIDYSPIDPQAEVYIPTWDPPDFGFFKLIPLTKAELSAGGGAFVISEDKSDLYAFRKDWLYNKASSTNNVVLMPVRGDSMEPIIIDGDVVMIDKGRKSVHDGYIYALGIGETISIKRLNLLPNGCCRVRSDNPEFESYEVDLKEIRILGQVIWRAGRPSFSPPKR